jgi:hypothetical protein
MKPHFVNKKPKGYLNEKHPPPENYQKQIREKIIIDKLKKNK